MCYSDTRAIATALLNNNVARRKSFGYFMREGVLLIATSSSFCQMLEEGSSNHKP